MPEDHGQKAGVALDRRCVLGDRKGESEGDIDIMSMLLS
jgi:hypothetical protein